MSDLLNKASLVMIPSGYKEDVVYSAVPTDGSGDLSFTRASNGTRINSAGLVEVVPWNLLLNTNTFSSWDLEGGTLTSGFNAPDGSSTAYKYVQTSGGFYSGSATATSGNKTVTVWLKSVSGTSITCNLADGGGSNSTTVTVTGDWQLFTFTYTTSTSRPSLYIYSISNASGIYVWHPQLNIGSTAKPYFPTTDRLNVPRLTYQNGGGGCPSLLLEKQSTNGVYPSEDFTNANWYNNGGASVTANTAISPDGTQNADTLACGTSTALYNPNGVSGGAIPFTASIYVKQIDFNVFRFGMTDDTLEEFSYNYNLDTLAVSAATSPTVWTNTSGTITSVGNGWFRVTITGTKGVLGVARMVVKGQTSSKNYYIWGAQLEASSYPTSYIPTTSSSATRVADACYKTGISSLIGQTEGTIFLDAYFDDLDTVNFSISDGTSGNYVLIDSSGGAVVFARVQQGGVTQATINTSASFYTAGSRLKCAIAYKANDFAFYINGNLIGTDNSGSVPACDQIRFARWNGAVPATQRINEVITFKTRLTNAELASLTTI